MKYHNLLVYLLLILAALFLTSCMYYTKEESFRNSNSDQDEWLIKKSIYRGLAQDDYIVLREDNEMWHLYDLNLSDDEQTLTAKREKVSANHQIVINGLQTNKNKGYGEYLKAFIHQVHFYPRNYDFDEETEIVSININEIMKLDIYKHNERYSKNSTRNATILAMPFIGLPILYGIVLVLSLIACC